MRVWKNSRVVNTGSATHGVGPRAVAITSDDIDISETSNSANLSCRQNISEGCTAIGVRLMPSGTTSPSISGRVFGLSESAMLSARRLRAIPSVLLEPELGDDRGPFVVLGLHVLGEGVGRAAARLGGEPGQRLLHGLRAQRLVGRVVELGDDRRRGAERRQQRHPGAAVDGGI